MPDNETIADIIAEKRRRADELEASSYRPHQFLRERIAELRREADRLDAARKRELSKNVSKNGADFGQLGNAAKLREAVKAVVDVGYPHNFQAEAPHIYGYCCDITRAIEKCFAALSAPPRNCDRFAIVDEARKAHEEYRGDYIMRASNIFDFPMEFDAWLFAPATEKEGGAK